MKDKQPDLFYRWGRHNLANVTKGSQHQKGWEPLFYNLYRAELFILNISHHTFTSLTRERVKNFHREGQSFPGGRILIFFPENVKYDLNSEK